MNIAFDDIALIARVRAKVLDAVAREAGALHRTVRAGAGQWLAVAPGVERKLLWEKGDATS